MCEVNIDNFEELFPEIKKILEESKFFSIDMEFSALYPLPNQVPSLFDTLEERYLKLKLNLEYVAPLQFGLTAFALDERLNSYRGQMYNFCIQPACFQYINRSIFFQTDTLNFLKIYNFDFNKVDLGVTSNNQYLRMVLQFVQQGIPFMNRDQEKVLRDKLSQDEISEYNICCRTEIEEIIRTNCDLIKKWYATAQVGDFLVIPEVCNMRHNEEALYFIHKAFRSRFKDLWTCFEDGKYFVKKLSNDGFLNLHAQHPLEDELVDRLLGFSKLFRLLVSLKKPIIGHNVLQDLLLMTSNFETALPDSYIKWKELINEMFPVIFDTKSISYHMERTFPIEQRWNSQSLNTIFNFFKHEKGRLMAPNSPAIEMKGDDSMNQFHHAGYDSFCTGYIFIRLAHLKIYKNYHFTKRFVSSEYIAGLEDLKNRVNIIKGTLPYMMLDRVDLKTNKALYLVVETLNKKPVNIQKVAGVLSSYGFVEVKKLPYYDTKALVAVNNYSNARWILEKFVNDSEYKIQQYNLLRHSPVVQFVLMSGLAISGAAILLLTHSLIKK
ncbi:hypothetical protein ABEB36_013386 [Hypothenemus hampei]|uniref:Uncharacterized protein n=1 Tax=Hypothenemus hampei TaxID=57062 RepID=A0ABD1E835_HYPHA